MAIIGPTAAEVRKIQIMEEIGVPGVVHVMPKEPPKTSVAVCWLPDSPVSCRVAMSLLLKHNVKFSFDSGDEGVELEVGDLFWLKPHDWLLYDGVHWYRLQPSAFERDYRIL